MIGDLRTDALHEALGRAPIEDDTLLALLVLAFAGQNVSIASGNADWLRSPRTTCRAPDRQGRQARLRARHAAAGGPAPADRRAVVPREPRETAVSLPASSAMPSARTASCRTWARTISCRACPARRSRRPARTRRCCRGQRVKDTRAALVKHFSEGRFVHPAALFAPSPDKVVAWVERYSSSDPDELDETSEPSHDRDGEDAAAVARISLRMKASRSPPAPMPSRPNSPLLSFRTISAVGSGRRRLRTQRADFPHCVPPFASRQSLLFPQPSQEDTMSAQFIYDRMPLGSLVRYSDGAPRPPERFKSKLAAWENNNNGGRLVRKAAARPVGNTTMPASITLHKGDFGSASVVRSQGVQDILRNTPLTFTVVERPKPGLVRVLDRAARRRAPPSRRRSRRGGSLARYASPSRRGARRGHGP